MRHAMFETIICIMFLSAQTGATRQRERIMSSLKNKVNTETSHSNQRPKKTYMQHKITAFTYIVSTMAASIGATPGYTPHGENDE